MEAWPLRFSINHWTPFRSQKLSGQTQRSTATSWGTGTAACCARTLGCAGVSATARSASSSAAHPKGLKVYPETLGSSLLSHGSVGNSKPMTRPPAPPEVAPGAFPLLQALAIGTDLEGLQAEYGGMAGMFVSPKTGSRGETLVTHTSQP